MRFLWTPVSISMRGKIRSTDTTKQVETERISEETKECQRKWHNLVDRVRPERMPWQAYYRPIWRRDTGRPSRRWSTFTLSRNGSWLGPSAESETRNSHTLGGSLHKTNSIMQGSYCKIHMFRQKRTENAPIRFIRLRRNLTYATSVIWVSFCECSIRADPF